MVDGGGKAVSDCERERGTGTEIGRERRTARGRGSERGIGSGSGRAVR